MRIAGLILAGGRSSRMEGHDKALQPLAGRPLVARVVERLSAQVEILAINTSADPAPFAPYRCPIVPDTVPGFAGPLAGVLAGLDWAARTHDAIVTVAVDTPFLPSDLVTRLAAAGGPCVAVSAGQSHPVFALWPVGLRERLRDFLETGGTRRVTAFQEAEGFTPVDFPLLDGAGGPLDPFLNINTPDDLERAQAIAAAIP